MRMLGVALWLLLVCTACGPADDPPPISYGRDVCVRCGMIVSDPRFAAAYRLDDGSEWMFDDLGELVAHLIEHDRLGGARAWVNDRDTGEPVPAIDAYFVHVPGDATPMGWGVSAFGNRAAAEAFAAAHGVAVLSWFDLVDEVRSGEVGEPFPAVVEPSDDHGQHGGRKEGR